MRNELKSTLAMDRLKLHRVVKSIGDGKKFQTLKQHDWQKKLLRIA